MIVLALATGFVVLAVASMACGWQDRFESVGSKEQEQAAGGARWQEREDTALARELAIQIERNRAIRELRWESRAASLRQPAQAPGSAKVALT